MGSLDEPINSPLTSHVEDAELMAGQGRRCGNIHMLCEDNAGSAPVKGWEKIARVVLVP